MLWCYLAVTLSREYILVFYQREANFFSYLVHFIPIATTIEGRALESLLQVKSLETKKLNKSLLRRTKISDAYIKGVVTTLKQHQQNDSYHNTSSMIDDIQLTLTMLKEFRDSEHNNSSVAYLLNKQKTSSIVMDAYELPSLLHINQLERKAHVLLDEGVLESLSSMSDFPMKSLFYCMSRHTEFVPDSSHLFLNVNVSLSYVDGLFGVAVSESSDHVQVQKELKKACLNTPKEIKIKISDDNLHGEDLMLVYTPIVIYRDQILTPLDYCFSEVKHNAYSIIYLTGLKGLSEKVNCYQWQNSKLEYIMNSMDEYETDFEFVDNIYLTQSLLSLGFSSRKVFNDGYPSLPLNADIDHVTNFFNNMHDSLIHTLSEHCNKIYEVKLYHSTEEWEYEDDASFELLNCYDVDLNLVSMFPSHLPRKNNIFGFSVADDSENKTVNDLLLYGKDVLMTDSSQKYTEDRAAPIHANFDIINARFKDVATCTWMLPNNMYCESLATQVTRAWKDFSVREKAEVILDHSSIAVDHDLNITSSDTEEFSNFIDEDKLRVTIFDLGVLYDKELSTADALKNLKYNTSIEKDAQIMCACTLISSTEKLIDAIVEDEMDIDRTDWFYHAFVSDRDSGATMNPIECFWR